MKKYNIGIIGAGNIATFMAAAINGCSDRAVAYAVASRDLGKAKAFAQKYHFQKAYGSYEELAADPNVDLVYIATPHSHHYEHAKLCVEHGVPVLVEKAFTGNVRQAKELITLAEEKKVFLTEAIWTRYIPAQNIIREVMDSGVLGDIQSLYAEFSVPLSHIQRMYDPNLAGGALLDLGMYALTFASMYFGDNIVSIETTCEKYETGVDATDDIVYTYANGKTAHLRTSFVQGPINEGKIFGTNGYLYASDLNNYSSIKRFDNEGNLVETYKIPAQINGYEYELLASLDAIERGELECTEMLHSETIEIMRQMDELRARWNVVYPFD